MDNNNAPDSGSDKPTAILIPPDPLRPTGMIAPYYGDERTFDATGPWLICNGSVFSRTQYPNLYQHLVRINPKLRVDGDRCYLPDFQGMFLRGFDKDQKVDPEKRTLGDQQGHAMQRTTVSFVDRIRNTTGPGSSRGLDGGGKLFVDGNKATATTRSQSFGFGPETRPVNVAVNYIIYAGSRTANGAPINKTVDVEE